MLRGSARTLAADAPAVVFEVEKPLYRGHDPYGPVRLLVDEYNYTCFGPPTCNIGEFGGRDHVCVRLPLDFPQVALVPAQARHSG